MPDQEPPKEEQVTKEEKDDKKPAPKPADSKKGENPELDRQPFHITKLDKSARSVDLSSDLRQLAVAHSDGFARIYQMTQPIEKKPAAAADPEKSKS